MAAIRLRCNAQIDPSGVPATGIQLTWSDVAGGESWRVEVCRIYDGTVVWDSGEQTGESYVSPGCRALLFLSLARLGRQ